MPSSPLRRFIESWICSYLHKNSIRTSNSSLNAAGKKLIKLVCNFGDLIVFASILPIKSIYSRAALSITACQNICALPIWFGAFFVWRWHGVLRCYHYVNPTEPTKTIHFISFHFFGTFTDVSNANWFDFVCAVHSLCRFFYLFDCLLVDFTVYLHCSH